MYSETLAARVRKLLVVYPDITEVRMFGGLVFLQGGKMMIGVLGDDLMVRVGAVAYEAALARPHVRLMDFTGRPLTGLVYVGPPGTRTATAVAAWIERAHAFVAGLPPPERKRRTRPWQMPPRR